MSQIKNNEEDVPIKVRKHFFQFVLILLTLPILLTSCKSKEKLLFLNWGEYVNDELVEQFEELYNCEVVIDIADSNELFYSKIKSGTTAYDLCAPSDYMIEKMYQKNLIQELNMNNIPNYNKSAFIPTLVDILDDLEQNNEGISKYHAPYFWGTFGLMYNKNKQGLEEALKDPLTGGWNAYFERTTLPLNTTVGMYNVSRFDYAACMLYNKISPNVLNDDSMDIFEKTLNMHPFDLWGTDTLKKGVESGNLDLAYVYTGDCLDMIYLKISDSVALEDMTFDIYVPNETILHLDSLVIPKDARNKELAEKFINFMLEPTNAYLNSSVVGYCTPLIDSYKMIVNKVGITPSSSKKDIFWYENWAKCVEKYYPMNSDNTMNFKGQTLSFFDKEELTLIDNLVNKVKTS